MMYGTPGGIQHVNLVNGEIREVILCEEIYHLFLGRKGLANGLLTGTSIATANRVSAAAKSPLSGEFRESEPDGFWSPEVSLCEAGHLWGQEPDWVEAQIRTELESTRIQVLQPGLAGENQVRYASLTQNQRHYKGRNGIGAVMGSKNLKARAVRSSGGNSTRNTADPLCNTWQYS